VIESPLEDGQICVVLEGKVRVLLVSTDGRELAIAERVAGDLVEVVTGCQEAYCPGERIAVAGQEGARVFFLPAHEFLCAVTVTQEGALHLVEALQDATRGRDRVIGELAFCSVRARVARVVSRLARESDGCLVRETHQEIAVRAGTGREEVSRVLASFRRQNLLEPTGRGQIRVLQPERLVDETSSPV
jgi:CRP-like cAMP-binding protein